MTFCPNCGAQATGSFCPNCGTPLGNPSNPAGTSSQGYGRPSTVGSGAQGITDHLAGALCYIPFLVGLICSLAFLLIAPYNGIRTVRFHAFQSIFLHVALFILSLALSMIIGLFALATHGLGFLLGGLYPILWLATLVLFLYLMYQTYNRQKVKLPVVGDLADKQA